MIAVTPGWIQLLSQSGLSHVQKTNGVAVADYDLDGDLDIFFAAHERYDGSDSTTWNRFFRNEGDGRFTDVTEEAGLMSQLPSGPTSTVMGYKFGVGWGDFDNDGYPDLFLTKNGQNELYHNQGGGNFVEISGAAGVQGSNADIHSSPLWWDYDLDGDLDLYVSVWRGENLMYENNGDSTFTNVTEASGLSLRKATWTTIPIDANNDGLLDLYAVNDFSQSNSLFINLGNKKFEEKSSEYGVNDSGDGMGVTIGDYNGDGFFDIYLTNITDIGFWYDQTNPLYTNTGQSSFVNMAAAMGVENAGWGWGTNFFDCDHDGDLDLYVVNGFDWQGGNEADTSNFFFEYISESANPLFVNRSQESGTGGWEDARGLVVFDYDNDGDLDLLVSNVKTSPFLYENTSSVQNWLKIDLQGTQSNRSAIGTVVKVTAGGKTYIRQNDGVNFLGQSRQPLHFGLGAAQIAKQIIVRWPQGNEENFPNVVVNQTIKIREDEGIITGIDNRIPTASIPVQFELIGNYPNPFNGSTLIKFNINRPGEVNLIITNILGQRVRAISQHYGTSGIRALRWNATDDQGRFVSSGIYLYTLTINNLSASGKMLYAK